MNANSARRMAFSASSLDEGGRTACRAVAQRRREVRGFIYDTARTNPHRTLSLKKREARETRRARVIELPVKILANKLFSLAVIVGVGIWFLVIPAVTGGLGANPPEKLLHRTGEIAIWTLGAVLSLSPLRALFPRSRLVNALNRHRRVIGVSVCVYGLMHFGFHLLYEGDAQAIVRSFAKPFIWFGLAGLSILVILAATSNNFSIRKLGGKNWKRLHRLAYAAAALLIYHQAIAGKGHWHIARWLLFSLLALQIARLFAAFLRKRNAAAVAGGDLSAVALAKADDPGPRKTGNRIGSRPASSRVGGTTTTCDRTL
jgi:sulfoxide reductase heme-binding subunit YedZ